MSFLSRIWAAIVGFFSKPVASIQEPSGGDLSAGNENEQLPSEQSSPKSIKTVPWTVRLAYKGSSKTPAWEKTVTTPVKGKFCTEAHYATTKDVFTNGKDFPSTQSEGISIHLGRSLEIVKKYFPEAKSDTVYPASYHRVWTPPEGGKAGQGAVGNVKPTLEQEIWQGNMMFAPGEKPAPGTKFLVTNPKNGRQCVIQMGFEIGPGGKQYIGGLVSEVHYALGSSDATTLVLEKVEDQSISLGPVIGNPSFDPVETEKPVAKKRLQWLRENLGRDERNPEDDAYLTAVLWPLSTYCKSYKTVNSAINKDAKWCGVGQAMDAKEAGLRYPKVCESAFSYAEDEDYADPVDWETEGLREGDFVVLKSSHVTAADKDAPPGFSSFDGIGCNQSNKISVQSYGREEIMDVRRPKKA